MEYLKLRQFQTLSIAKGKSVVINLPSLSLINGSNEIEVSVNKINGVNGDDFGCNNKAVSKFSAVRAAEYKAILVEEGTGPWCQWCPRGAVFMDRLTEYYPNLFIPIAVHNGTTNPMKVAEYDSFMGFTSFPSSRVNRQFDQDPSQLETPFLAEIVKPTPAIIRPGARYNATTKTLDVSTEVEFLEAQTGDFVITVVLTEDGVRGTSTAYNQANAYAGGAAGVMGGYELLPNPVPAARMVYHHVARATNSLEGEEANTFSGSFAQGKKASLTTSFVLNSAWNPDSIHIVSILLNGTEYVNAASATIAEAVANGFVSGAEDIVLSADKVKLYPNPADESTNIYIDIKTAGNVKIELMDVNGKLVASRDYGSLVGEMVLPINIDQLSSGMYLAKVTTPDGSIIQKLNVK